MLKRNSFLCWDLYMVMDHIKTFLFLLQVPDTPYVHLLLITGSSTLLSLQGLRWYFWPSIFWTSKTRQFCRDHIYRAPCYHRRTTRYKSTVGAYTIRYKSVNTANGQYQWGAMNKVIRITSQRVYRHDLRRHWKRTAETQSIVQISDLEQKVSFRHIRMYN